MINTQYQVSAAIQHYVWGKMSQLVLVRVNMTSASAEMTL